ncbi:MAG: hypothetical protein HY650_04080, partial [Acidobacteria bacterium]|nr:hypothetical protein [Acidobacteriota bacterium]
LCGAALLMAIPGVTGNGYSATLEHVSSGSAAGMSTAWKAGAQVSGIAGIHRAGQTFVTWQELASEDGESYEIYRHTEPISAANLAQAQRLTARWGPLPEGSSRYYIEDERRLDDGVREADQAVGYTPLENYVISDLGSPLSGTTGLFVWTAKQSGSFYYAVTTIPRDGRENRTDFSAGYNTTGPMAEAVEDPRPILVWQSKTGFGRVYTQFMDYEHWNPTFDAPRDPEGSGTNKTHQYAYNYWVGVPVGYDGRTPLPLYLHIEGWGSRYGIGESTPYDWPAIEIWGDDPHQTWYYGFSATFDYRHCRSYEGTGCIADTGPIVNYTEERLLRALYDVLRDRFYQVDRQRIYSYGQSMGGSGALSLGIRYPNVFAAIHAGQPMTNYAADNPNLGGDWLNDYVPKWGRVEAQLPIENRGVYATDLARYDGMSVWDWQNHQATLARWRAREMAFISIDHGTLDEVIEWETQARPVYGQFYAGLRAFSGAIVEADHTWLGFAGEGPDAVGDYAPFHDFTFRSDETTPALHHASGSLRVPPSGAGGYNLNLEWSASWHDFAGPPVDTPSRYEIVLRSLEGAQTVDVTPRRVQRFVIRPGMSFSWLNTRLSDDQVIQGGTISADADGLITLTGLQVGEAGNRLVLQPVAVFAVASNGVGQEPMVGSRSDLQISSSAPRPFPDTRRGIHVFNDQLVSLNALTDEQVRFAATHYSGAQKMTRADAERLRTLNPNFLILHYRLGHALGYRAAEGACQPVGEWLQIIDGDWTREWPGDSAVSESWFFHWRGERVYNCDWGWYLLELNDPGLRGFWQADVLGELQANDNDGVFMDSLSVPNYLGADHYVPALPEVDDGFESEWVARITGWLIWLRGQALGRYHLVPNVGSWITSREATDYSPADGLMVEGFAIEADQSPYNLEDWRLQMNRILGAVRRGQAILGQSYVTGGQERLFALGSYLLIKGNRSYLNIDLGMEPEWWPEYDIPIGTAQQDAGDIMEFDQDGDGVYQREFDNGLVLVNPTSPWDGTGVTRTVNFSGTRYLAEPGGGGVVPASGVPDGVVRFRPVTEVTLPPFSTAVLLNVPPSSAR